jgi:hypothetical protein
MAANALSGAGDAASIFSNATQMAQSGDPSSALQAQQQAYQESEKLAAQSAIMQAQHDAMMAIIHAISQ